MKQHRTLGEIEVLIDDSESYADGGMTVGAKRQALLDSSNGKYVCFLDDDESISPDYVETLMRLCNENKDVCTFKSLYKCDTYWSVIDMSIKYQTNEQATPMHETRRKAWHICPVLSKYAKKYRFNDINNAEDWQWFEQVSNHLTFEAKTNKVIHQYNHSSKTSEVDRIWSFQY